VSQPRTYRDAIQRGVKTQRFCILRLLIDARGAWVPLLQILDLGIAQYGARILELRRQGFVIENRCERLDGKRHSWFRLVQHSPSKSSPVDNSGESDFMRRRRAEDDQAMPLFSGVPE
jgi:Helix-turn-helix domain